MIINLAYKYRLVVSKSQKQLLLNHIFAHNQTWNILLSNFFKESETNQSRKENGLESIYLSESEKDSMIKKILNDRKLDFNTKVVQQCMRIFNKNLFYTLSEIKKGNTEIGMLKFKDSKNFNNQGFKTTKEQFSILDSTKSEQALLVRKNPKYKILRLFRQNFKIRWTRDCPLNSEIKTLNISFKDNQFYVSFNVSYESNLLSECNKQSIACKRMITDIHSTNGIGLHDNLLTECNKQSIACKKKISNDIKSIGMDINIDSIDLGNKLFHKSFNIKDIKTMNIISKNEKKIKRLKRKQSRRVEVCKKTKTKLGKNFYKTQNKLNKISTKNSNKKVFQLHQIVNEIINFMKENNYNHIVMEDLNVKQMTSKDNVNKTIGKKKTKSMRKNILQISFSMFKYILTYKCAMNGVYVSLVDPKNTSKSCSCCGNIDNQLNITKRVYECKECGLKIKRDHNSCINMINKFYK